MASLAFSLLAISDAYAGSYSAPTYSGSGAAMMMVNNASKAVPYGPTSSGWGGGSGGVPSASCTGSIMAAFTWQPTNPHNSAPDLPPTQVVVTETCMTSTAVAIPYQTGAWNTWLGVPGSTGTVTCIPGGSSNSVSTTSVRYTAQAGGPTVTLPSVSPSSTGNGYGASCTVGYTAAVSPVFIVLGGATEDSGGNYNILVGQGCSVSLVGIPSALLNNTNNPPTYQWTITGTTFDGWIVSSNQQTATLESNPSPLTSKSSGLAWYWNDPANKSETVTCAVTLTPPTGQGSAFTLTVTQPVSVMLPTYSCTHAEGGAFVSQDGQEIQATPTSNANGHGETWFGNVQTPALFGSGGYWSYSQIITGHRSHNYGFDVPCTENGKTGLDTVTPYPAEDNDGFNAGPDTNTKIGWLADNTQHRDGDSPGTATFDAYPTQYGVASSVSVTNELFSTYLMYVPPGGNVQPVPLHEINWNWSAMATKPANGWATLYGTSIGNVTATSSARSNTHPTWTRLEGAGVGRYW